MLKDWIVEYKTSLLWYYCVVRSSKALMRMLEDHCSSVRWKRVGTCVNSSSFRISCWRRCDKIVLILLVVHVTGSAYARACQNVALLSVDLRVYTFFSQSRNRVTQLSSSPSSKFRRVSVFVTEVVSVLIPYMQDVCISWRKTLIYFG